MLSYPKTINMCLAWVIMLVAVVFCDQEASATTKAEGIDLQLVAPRTRILNSIDENDLVTLVGNQHPLVREGKNDIGRADDGIRFERMILSLKSDGVQMSGLEKFLVAAHDSSSVQYHQWLSEKKFEDHFGIAQGDVAQVVAWLTAHGFTVDEIPSGGRAIIFSGTVAQVNSTFHTEIHHYLINGEDHLANATEPQIPTALSAVVDGVVSLHNIHSRPLYIRSQLVPDYTSGSNHYLAASDFQTIYNLKLLHANGINGSGGSIAILGRSNVVLSDIQQFRTTMNLAASTPQIIVNGADPGLVSGDEGESDLDLEWSGAVAPGAVIKFVTSASTGSTDGIALSAQYAVSNNVADVISLSYGQCETSMGATALNYFGNLWQQAAALGITVNVSAGDSGAAGCDSASSTRASQGRAVNGLCTSPYATCVGGTQFADTANPSLYWSSSNNPTNLGSALSYIPEVAWNESGSNGGKGLWASGGGASTFYTKPSWQTTLGVPNDGRRDVPDVALTAASHDGYLVYSSDNATHTQTLYAFGGTSASAPSFAGIIALVNQETGYRQGNVNQRLYGLANRQAGANSPAYFHQLTSGNNSVPGVVGFSASTTTPYYNQVTGLGSVDGNVLVNHWVDLLPISVTTLTSTPNPSISGQSITFNAAVTGVLPTGTVQFSDGTTLLGTPVVLNNGNGSITTSSLTAGSHGITVTYSGDPGNQPSVSSTLTQQVMNMTTVSVIASPASIYAGEATILTATVGGASLSGTIQFKDGTSNLGAPIVVSSTTAVLFTNALATAGMHSVTAYYSGDTNNAPSTSPIFTVSVSQATSSVTLTASSQNIDSGNSVTLTATVSGVSPTGTVQFTDGISPIGAVVAIGSGVATLTTTNLAIGSHNIAATYSGDANNLGSRSAPLAIVVNNPFGDVDTPTLPQWAIILLGSMLMLTVWSQTLRSSR